MTIRDLKKYIERLWDWGFLDDCWGGTRIKVSDIDGIVERKGKFLVLEPKGIGINVPMGQRLMFEAMVRTGYFVVVIIWGETNKPLQAQVLMPSGIKMYNNANVELIRNIAKCWFSWANGNIPELQLPDYGK